MSGHESDQVPQSFKKRNSALPAPNNPQTTYQYNDNPGQLSVAVSKLLCTSTPATSTTNLDGLGRPTETIGENGAMTFTTYDGLGQVWTVSNPSFTDCRPNCDLTTYTRDGQGRVKTLTRPDQNTVTTSYSGYCATVTDEALNSRLPCSDALGRITQVTEAPGVLGYVTNYTYDALDNLLTVTQGGGGQTRTFGYNSLSWVTSAANPESGMVQYTYDANGNVQTRLDARGITTTYGYDGLNRLTSKSYNDGVTPSANFSYDETSVSVNGTPINVYSTNGRMTHWTTTAAGQIQTEGIYSYNGVGGVQDFWECTPFDCGTVSNNGSMFSTYYEYDLAGDLGVYAVPAGAVYPWVNAAQQVYQVKNGTFSGVPSLLAQNITYAPTGAVATLQDGCTGSNCTGLQEQWTYNKRLQPVMVQVGTTASPNSVSCDAYYYYPGFSAPSSCPSPAPTSGTRNNGNTWGWYHWDGDPWNPGPGVLNTTSYNYDAVNRLTSASIPNHYSQTYSYTGDGSNGQYGNMACSGNYCGPPLTFSATTNQITTINGSTTGVSYDLAGNLTGDGSASNAHTFQWDAENRLISVDNGNTASFAYNALGQRVQKAAGGQTTYYYHDASGNIAMNEITSVGQTHVHEYFFPTLAGRTYAKYYWTGSAWETEYLHGNPLGSSQIVMRSDNSYLEAEILFPFGGLRWSGGGTQDVRFAGMQERDGETTAWQDPLDPTPNRLYTSGLGRWLSPDPAGKKAASLVDPQTWNMYAYVRGSPTMLTDPSGLYLQNLGLMNTLRAQLHASEAENEEEYEQEREAGAATPPAPGSSTAECQPVQDEQQTAQNQNQKQSSAKKKKRAHRPIVQGKPDPTEKKIGAASREVEYDVVDSNGNQITRTQEVRLDEKFLSGEGNAAICNGPGGCTETTVLVDDQGVLAHRPYTVERRWQVGGQDAGVRDPSTGKVYDYEVIKYDYDANPPIKTEYRDDE